MNRAEYMLKPFLDNEDLIRERSHAGIENARKGYGVIQVTDACGNPVPGAAVRLRQRSHDFHYGANLFMLDELETPEKNAVYRKTFPKYFNLATLPFYWDTLEPVEGKPRLAADSPKVYRRPAPDLCLNFCEENNIAPKAHCLNYDSFTPDWLQKYSAAEQWEKLEERFRILAERYARRIHGWEVTNELWWNRARTKIYFDPDYMERSFRLAERYFPSNELISNDWQSCFRSFFHYNRDCNFMQLERAILKGARIDTIGLQYHLFSTPETEEAIAAVQLDPVNMYSVFDTYAALRRPMQITEVTIPCQQPDSREAESIQAEVLRYLYTIWFGVPDMEAIIYWNLVDGYAYNAEPGDFSNGENTLAGGLMRFDMTPKPALDTLRTLFEKEWHTEAALVADDGGRVRFKGFYGTYDVEIHAGEKSAAHRIHLEKTVERNPTFTVTL